MKLVSTAALALALTIGGSLAVEPAFAAKKEAAPKGPAISPGLREPAIAVQAATKANDLATAKAKLAEAEAAIVTDQDRYIVGQLTLAASKIGGGTDEGLYNHAIDLMAAGQGGTPEQHQQLLVAQGQIAYNAKNYPKAEAAMLAAQQAGSTDSTIVPVLVSAMVENHKALPALQLLNEAIAKQVAAGQAVPESWYEKGVDTGYRTKSTDPNAPAIYAQTIELVKKWIAAYPKKRTWSLGARVYSDLSRLDTETQTDLFRLQRAAGGLAGDGEYREYADNVLLRFPNESNSVLQEGIAKGVVNKSNRSTADMLSATQTKIAADKASLVGGEKAARAAANGRAALSTADALVGYGDYAKAIDLYKVALAKGGVDANVVNLHMGWALAQSGDAAGAKTAFAAVTGPRKTIADLWVIHLDHPTVAG